MKLARVTNPFACRVVRLLTVSAFAGALSFAARIADADQGHWYSANIDPQGYLHPRDAVVAGVDVDGTPLSVCRISTLFSTNVGKTRPDWGFCDIGVNGVEDFERPGGVWGPHADTLTPAWVTDVNGLIPGSAVRFGQENGTPLFVCRGFPTDPARGLQVGKIEPGFSGCHIPYGGHEVVVRGYDVLTVGFPSIAATGTPLPPQALVGGYDDDSSPLFICIGFFQGGWHPGKMRSNWGTCDIAWGGGEHWVTPFVVIVPQFTASSPGSNFFVADTAVDGTPEGICTAPTLGSIQVGQYTNGVCTYGFGGAEYQVAVGAGAEVLSSFTP
jgi:hypothetical protein